MNKIQIKTRFPALPELDELYTDLMTNFVRVEHLVIVYEELRKKHKTLRGPVWSHIADVLRAAVVLCHATLEEGLRGLIYIEAEWNKEFLANVPLKGENHINRPGKFNLAELLPHQGLKVEELISESVFDYLNSKSFSRIEDVIRVIELLNLKVSNFEHFFKDITSMMQRRHNIAHNGDQNELTGKGHHPIKPIRASTVRNWNALVQTFFMDIAMQIQGLPPMTLPQKNERQIAEPSNSAGGNK